LQKTVEVGPADGDGFTSVATFLLVKRKFAEWSGEGAAFSQWSNIDGGVD